MAKTTFHSFIMAVLPAQEIKSFFNWMPAVCGICRYNTKAKENCQCQAGNVKREVKMSPFQGS